MKNLKKVLSLALALVMAMSLMTTAFAADVDFTDADEITNVEAVEVMAAIGILEGNNGEFDPQGTLTREQAAKMITYMLLGTTDAEKQPAKAIFGDVKADRWSASYIAYCASEGIINGKSATTFAPAANVTGYEYAKMLLCALGYDATEKGLTGDSWAINTGKYFVAEGLDIEGVDMNADLSRENAAQMTLNAMKWNGSEKVYGVDEGNDRVADKTFDDRTDAILYATTGNYTYLGEVETTEGSLIDTVYDINAYRGIDAFGRPANVYANADWDADMVYADAPVASFTGPVTEKEIFKVVGAAGVVVDQPDFVVEDGRDVTPVAVHKTGAEAAWTAAYTGNGITTEIYEVTLQNGDTGYKMVAIREYLAEVKTVNDANATNETARNIVVDLKTLPGGFESTYTCEAYDTEEFEEDDVVVVTVSTKNGVIEIQSIEKVTKVENVAVTAYKQGGVDVATVTANGVTYKYSQNNVMTTASDTFTMDGKATYTFYVDSFNNILKAEQYSAAASADYVLLLDIGSGTYGSTDFTGSSYKEIKIVDMAGTVSILKVDASDMKDTDGTSLAKNAWYTVAEDADNAEWVTLSRVNYTDSTKDKAMTVSSYNSNTISSMDSKDPTVGSLVADNGTIFVLNTDNTKDKTKVVTGLSNLPKYESLSTKATGVIGTDGFAVVIYVDVTSASATNEAADVLYLIGGKTGTYYDEATEKTYDAYDAIVDGKIVTVKVAAGQNMTSVDDMLIKVTEYNADGYITAAKCATVDTDSGATTDGYAIKTVTAAQKIAYSAPTLNVNGAYYTMAADAVVTIYETNAGTLTVGTVADIVDDSVDYNATMTLTYADDDTTVTGILYVYAK